MSRLDDKLRALEALLLASPVVEPARTFTVPMSLRLIAEYGAVVAEARAACGHPLTPDAVPLILDGCEIAWAQVATAQQAFLIDTGRAHMAGVAEREAIRVAAEIAAQQPAKPQRQSKPPPIFVHHPNPFARA